jgi:two-component system, LytTR family, response regulator
MSDEIHVDTIKPIILKTPTGFVYYDYADIILCSADGNCTNIFNVENDTPVRVLHNISFIESKYQTDKFFRCHKSHIINLQHVERLITKSHQVQLKNNYIVPLSYKFWRKLKQLTEKSISKQ